MTLEDRFARLEKENLKQRRTSRFLALRSAAALGMIGAAHGSHTLKADKILMKVSDGRVRTFPGISENGPGLAHDGRKRINPGGGHSLRIGRPHDSAKHHHPAALSRRPLAKSHQPVHPGFRTGIHKYKWEPSGTVRKYVYNFPRIARDVTQGVGRRPD